MASYGSPLQTLLALVAVLALIMALAWGLKRLQRSAGTANGKPIINLRGQLMVGPRERVVVLEIGDQWIVAGVAAGNVRPLAVLPKQDAPEDLGPSPDDAPPSFAACLARLRIR